MGGICATAAIRSPRPERFSPFPRDMCRSALSSSGPRRIGDVDRLAWRPRKDSNPGPFVWEALRGSLQHGAQTPAGNLALLFCDYMGRTL